MSGDQFNGVAVAAANMPAQGEKGMYVAEMFFDDFPQFKQKKDDVSESLVPEAMLQLFIDNANTTILPGRYHDMWRYAAGLFVAHYSTLYLKTYCDSSTSAANAAAKGQPIGLIKEASMGDTSIRYDNEAITAAMAKWGAWNATQYGQQLVTMARMIGMGGMYVI